MVTSQAFYLLTLSLRSSFFTSMNRSASINHVLPKEKQLVFFYFVGLCHSYIRKYIPSKRFAETQRDIQTMVEDFLSPHSLCSTLEVSLMIHAKLLMNFSWSLLRKPGGIKLLQPMSDHRHVMCRPVRQMTIILQIICPKLKSFLLQQQSNR